MVGKVFLQNVFNNHYDILKNTNIEKVPLDTTDEEDELLSTQTPDYISEAYTTDVGAFDIQIKDGEVSRGTFIAGTVPYLGITPEEMINHSTKVLSTVMAIVIEFSGTHEIRKSVDSVLELLSKRESSGKLELGGKTFGFYTMDGAIILSFVKN